MKRTISFILVILLVLSCLVQVTIFSNSTALISSPKGSDPDHILDQGQIVEKLPHSGGHFTENRGQLSDDSVRFYIQGQGVWFQEDGVSFDIRPMVPSKVTPGYVIKQEFVGANPVRPIGLQALEYQSNFFYGSHETNWFVQVPNYLEVLYRDIWDGIDLRYYTLGEDLKYDLIVHPGAHVEQVRMRYEGAEGISIGPDGSLVVETPFGKMEDTDLFIYQERDGGRYTIDGDFSLLDGLDYGFKLTDDYDTDHVLIIDPSLDYSTYVGGSNNENGEDIAIDSLGNALITGHVWSTDFPTSVGAYNASLSGGNLDAFILKLNADGTLNYSTYIGGNGVDDVGGIAVDSSGNAYITGETSSDDFPITVGAYDDSKWGATDLFILKLNPYGTDLVYSTYVGSNQEDGGASIAVDGSGNAYVTGWTAQGNFPTTSGAFDESYNTGDTDAIVLKLNLDGTSLLFSTFLGGSFEESSTDIAMDSSGNIFVTGHTTSSNFPVTANANRTVKLGGADAFVAQLNSAGSSLQYSTFIGGNSTDSGDSITLDTIGNIYVTGTTESSDFPVTPGAFDPTYHGGPGDIFVTKLNPLTTSLLYSTYIGGAGSDRGLAIAVDFEGNAKVTGSTSSIDFPVTSGAHSHTLGGTEDAFLLGLSASGSNIHYSSFIGGSGSDEGRGIWIDEEGGIFITGKGSSGFPTSPDAYSTAFNGGISDVFISRFFSYFLVDSLEFLRGEASESMAFARLDTYTLRLNITNRLSLSDLVAVDISIDPQGADIHLLWTKATGQFSKYNDPEDRIELLPSSSTLNDSLDKWRFDFDVIFNWNYDNEDSNAVSAQGISATFPIVWYNVSDLFHLENDLEFTGALLVADEDGSHLSEDDLVRGGEVLTWSGLVPVYEGTTDVYPPSDEIDVAVWDAQGSYWSDSPGPGEAFNLETHVALETNTIGNVHTVNILGIPIGSDATSETFSIMVDADNITFEDPSPGNMSWQTVQDVTAGITISDTGGSLVDGISVEHSLSTDNGTTWGTWTAVTGLVNESSITTQALLSLEEGPGNLIKWMASDTSGNGPTVSEPYRILVDSQEVLFSDITPLKTEESATEDVTVSVTITDITSGVNASSIEYAISNDSGAKWSPWTPVLGHSDDNNIDVTLDLSFPNGTGNRVKWRATDIAGNGPTESPPVTVNINTWLETIMPKVELTSPKDSFKITADSVTLSWTLNSTNTFGDVTYEIFFDTVNPPVEIKKSDHPETSLLVSSLSDKTTYYWTVVPKADAVIGTCLSGVWSFSYDKDVTLPSLDLVSPVMDALIYEQPIELSWTPWGEGKGWRYDVFVGTEDPPLKIWTSDFEQTNYTVDGLEIGAKYYWTVVPFTQDGVYGTYGETVWSFETAGLGIEIAPISDVNISAGNTSQVKIEVKNTGTEPDRFRFSLETNELGQQVSLSSDNETEILPGENSTVVLFISISGETQSGSHRVVLNVESLKALDLGKTITSERDFIINIESNTSPDVTGTDSEGQAQSALWWIILLIVIIIIIFLVIILRIRQINARKRKRMKKRRKVFQPEIVKPGSVRKGPTASPITVMGPVQHGGNPPGGAEQPMYNVQQVGKYAIEGRIQYLPPVKPYKGSPLPLALPLNVDLKDSVKPAVEGPTTIENIFVLSSDNVPINHYTSKKVSSIDPDILSSMLMVIQSFVSESFKFGKRKLSELKFEEFTILISKGSLVTIAAIVKGPRASEFSHQIKMAIKEIEEVHGETIKEWDGEMESISSLDEPIMKLIMSEYS